MKVPANKLRRAAKVNRAISTGYYLSGSKIGPGVKRAAKRLADARK